MYSADCLYECVLDYPHKGHGECHTGERDVPKVPPPDAPEDVQKAWNKYRLKLGEARKLWGKVSNMAAQFIPCEHCNKTPWEGCQCLPF